MYLTLSSMQLWQTGVTVKSSVLSYQLILKAKVVTTVVTWSERSGDGLRGDKEHLRTELLYEVKAECLAVGLRIIDTSSLRSSKPRGAVRMAR